MSSLGSLNIQLSLDTVKFQQALSKSDHQTQRFVRNFTVDMDKARHSARQFADRTTTYLNNIEKAANNINRNSNFQFWDTIGGYAQTAGREFIQLADKSTELSNKLKLVTDDEIQHARAMASVYDISMKTAQSTQAVSAIYASFSQNAKELGINQQQAASVTETISKAVSISGASASEAQNALTQFSQTLLMGKMRAQEYNSIMTQTPAVMQAIARGLGVTMGELKQMSDDGKLTSDKMIQALEKSKASVDELYSKTATTVSGAMQNLQTATQKWVGELENSIGVSKITAEVISAVANNLDLVATSAKVAAAGYAAYYLSQTQHRLNANKTKLTAETAELVAVERQTTALYHQATAEANVAKNVLQTATAERTKIAQQIAGNSHQLKLMTTEEGRNRLKVQAITLARQEQIAIDNLTAAQLRYNVAKQGAVTAFNSMNVAATSARTAIAAAASSANLLSVGFNAAKGAGSALFGFLAANPLMIVGAVGMGIYEWYNNIEQSRQKALEFANNLEVVKEQIKSMNSISLTAMNDKLAVSAEELERQLSKAQRKIQDLKKEIENTPKFIIIEDDHSFETRIDNTRRITQLTRELNAAREEEQSIQQKLTNVNQTAADTAQRLATIVDNELRTAADNLGITLFDTDGKTRDFDSSMLLAANTAANAQSPLMTMADKIFNVGAEARSSAKDLYVFSHAARDAMALKNTPMVLAPQMDEKTQKFYERLKDDNAMVTARNKGDIKGQAEIYLKQQGFNSSTVGYDELMKQAEIMFGNKDSKSNGGKPKKISKDKSAVSAKKEASDAQKNREDYLDQVTNMSQKLAGLKAETADIALFGQTSQYQEVKKLTEDIAENAEKYSAYGTDGVKKLQEMAAQIDEAQQKVAIAQFSFSNGEKLKAMEFELTLLGKTRQEQELIQYNHELDLEAARLKVGMSKENIALLEKEIEALKKRRAEIQAQAEEARGSWEEGIKQGWNNIEADVSNVAANVANITENAFNGMADAMTDFVMTGKADFKSMAESIIRDISNMIIKMTLFKALENSLRGTSFGNFLGIPVSSAAQGGLIGSVGMPKVMLGGFSRGGYTGDGGKYVPAGLVHRGEYVITKEATARLGLDFLNHLNYGKRGFSSGGGVAVPRLPSVPTQISAQKQSSSIQLTQHYTIDARGADHGVEQRISDLLKQNKRETIAEIRNQIRRGGQFGKDFGVA